MTKFTGLRFEPETGYIARTPGFAVAYMSRAAHEQDPTLGHKMAAAPEVVEVLSEIVDYRGGADHALADPYVMDRINAALARARGETT